MNRTQFLASVGARGLAALAVLVVVTPFSTAGQETGDLSSRLQRLAAEHGLPAVGALVQRGDVVVARAVVGVRKLGDPTPVTLDDLWHIGSITKSFTSTLVGTYVDEGALQLETTIAELIGPDHSGNYAGLTLAQLLSHRSGLPANVDQVRTMTLRQEGRPLPEQRALLLRELLDTAPAAAPGDKYEYSNAGYIVVGALLEAKFGKPWETQLRERVLGPLHLVSAGFGPPGGAASTAGSVDQPRGHVGKPGSLRAIEPGPWADNAPFLGPAGTLHMSLTDLAKWGREHLRGELGHDGLLRAATYRRIHRAEVGDYAFGWVDQREADGLHAIWHNGSNTMWYALVAFDPAADVVVTVVTNGGIGAGPVIDQLARELFVGAREGAKAVEGNPNR